MSKVKIQGNASGTGVVTLTAPNTNTDRTITLPDETVSLTGAPAGLDDVGGVARATSGLLFNGDTAAANALDDYEEGYHDATIYINSVAWTGTVNNRRLRYVKIGKLVHVVGRIYIAGGCPTGSTDYFSFSLPFLSPSGSDYETSNEFQNIRFNDSYTFRLHGGASELKMQNDGSNAAMNVSSPHLNVNLTYISA